MYDPYGKPLIERWNPVLSQWEESIGSAGGPASAFGNPFLWTGQRYDADVELYHFLFRTYSPYWGRWLQWDPLGYVDGVNLYEYVRGSPISRTDPDGLTSVVVRALPWAAGAAAGDGPLPIGEIVGAGIVAAAATVDLYLIAERYATWKKYGDCSPMQHGLLQNAVNSECKSGEQTSCNRPGLTCDQIKENMAKNLACLKARNRINTICFRGGDAGHQKAADDASRAVINCAKAFAANNCHDPKKNCNK